MTGGPSSHNMPIQCDVLLVGAGPIGIECAIALKEAAVDFYHVERGSLAATIEWYAPGTTFFSSSDRIALAGVPLYTANQAKATREEYLLYLRSLVTQFQLRINLQTEVLRVERSGSFFEALVRSAGVERIVKAKKIILAIGDMHHPRLLNVPGEVLPHVSHYLEEPHSYFHQEVVIVGGKNSAIEAAIRLERVGAHVTLVYRGKEFDQKRIKYWLYPELLYLIRQKKIEVYLETHLQEISPEEVVLHSSVAREGQGEVFRQRAERVLLLTGYEQEKGLFESLGLTVEGEEKSPVLNQKTMESSIADVFVIGTAIAGTQTGGVKEFIETSHVHVERVVQAISGQKPLYSGRDIDPEFLEN